MLIQEPLDPLQTEFLRQAGFIRDSETILNFTKAGEGNMNVVIKVETDQRTFILKQSRPFVAKYPQVPAPLNRIAIEKEYYQTTEKNELMSKMSPKVWRFDQTSWLMAMEYFPDSFDYTGLYSEKMALDATSLEKLGEYLMELHSLPVGHYPDNKEMKALNHQHIFELPFQKENGMDLNTIQSGLQELSASIKENNRLVKIIKQLGDRYLSKGKQLLHGDFYPGSWLKVNNEIKIIDTEFSFLGDPEFDLGVMKAHLFLANQKEKIMNPFFVQYDQERLDQNLLNAYAGVEILRRLFGLAQLPLNLSLESKAQLAEKAINMILDEKM